MTDYYSAAQYETEALKKLDEIFQTHQVALMTGGSMMYADAVCKGIDDIPTVDNETRELMMQRYETEGWTGMRRTELLDPEYYAIVDRKNPNVLYTHLRSAT